MHNADVEVVAVNDLTSPQTNAHLLKYDSTQGTLGLPVTLSEGGMSVGDQFIQVLAERDPANLPWGELDIDVVIESTGRFTTRDAAAVHLSAGAKKVIISAPAGDADATFVSTSSPTPRARPTASCPWSRCSTTPWVCRPVS